MKTQYDQLHLVFTNKNDSNFKIAILLDVQFEQVDDYILGRAPKLGLQVESIDLKHARIDLVDFVEVYILELLKNGDFLEVMKENGFNSNNYTKQITELKKKKEMLKNIDNIILHSDFSQEIIR